LKFRADASAWLPFESWFERGANLATNQNRLPSEGRGSSFRRTNPSSLESLAEFRGDGAMGPGVRREDNSNLHPSLMTIRGCSLFSLFRRRIISQLASVFGGNPGPAPPRAITEQRAPWLFRRCFSLFR
jgi:hypothetical protein